MVRAGGRGWGLGAREQCPAPWISNLLLNDIIRKATTFYVINYIHNAGTIYMANTAMDVPIFEDKSTLETHTKPRL